MMNLINGIMVPSATCDLGSATQKATWHGDSLREWMDCTTAGVNTGGCAGN